MHVLILQKRLSSFRSASRWYSTLGRSTTSSSLRFELEKLSGGSIFRYLFWTPKSAIENKLAMDIHEGAKQLAELEINYPNGKSEYEHIIGPVSLPVDLIKKVEKEDVSVNNEMMNFVVRKCYEPIYKKCFDYKKKKICIIGTQELQKVCLYVILC